MEKKLSAWCKNAKIEMINRDLKTTTLAKELDMNRSYVSSILNGRVYSAPAVKKISDYLGIADSDTSPIPSIALCEQIETVYKKRIGKYLAKATMDEMKRIDKALAVSIGLGGNVKMSEYVREWAEAFKEPDPDPIEEKAMQILETAKPAPIQIPERLFDKERIKELEKDLIRVEAERDVFQKLYKEQLAIS